MREFLPVIRTAPLFNGIAEDELEGALACLGAVIRRFQKGAYLLRAGRPTESLGLMLAGGALVVQEDFWGNRNLLCTVRPGQSFAETFACAPDAPLRVDVVAERDAAALFLDIRRLLEVCPAGCAHHSRMIRNLMADLADKNLRLNEKLTHMGQRSTRAKLLSYLSAQAQRQGCAAFEIPFSRQQLADYLSVERSGLSAELCRMRDQGLLEFHRSQFVLKQAASPNAPSKNPTDSRPDGSDTPCLKGSLP